MRDLPVSESISCLITDRLRYEQVEATDAE